MLYVLIYKLWDQNVMCTDIQIVRSKCYVYWYINCEIKMLCVLIYKLWDQNVMYTDI